jgi:hypothetical protein
MFQVTSNSFVSWWSQNIFFLLPATVTLQMHRLSLMFFGASTAGCSSTWRSVRAWSFTRSRFTRHFQYELSGHRLNSVDSICDLGVVLDSKPNFTSHIDSPRMVGYIRRIGKEFKDPCTLKTLYNSFVRSHLDYASGVWNPYYGVHLKSIEAMQKKFLRFALRTLGWSRDRELPPYCQKCRLIDLDFEF